jgi:hypothetical protein
LPNAYIAAAGGGAALAVHPFDADFNAHLRSHYDAVNLIFAPGSTTATHRSRSLGRSLPMRGDASSTSRRCRTWGWTCFARRRSPKSWSSR